MTEEKSLKEKVDELYFREKESKKRPKKQLRVNKAKVSSGKKKKGYVAVMKIHENHQVSFEKVPIEESAYKLKEDTFHSLEKGDVFFYKGKHPLIIQPTTKKNPYNPLEGKNETKGQQHIMNLMSKHAISDKKNKFKSNWIVYLLIAGAVIFGVKMLIGG